MKMPNILYKYSKSLGMMQRNYTDVKDPEEWSDTKDQATITFLLCELAIAYDSQEKLAKQLYDVNQEIANIDKELAAYKVKYPEDFI